MGGMETATIEDDISSDGIGEDSDGDLEEREAIQAIDGRLEIPDFLKRTPAAGST